jgi:hypothetical protein
MAKGKKTGGRVKGVPNKLTTGAKEVIAQVASNIGGVLVQNAFSFSGLLRVEHHASPAIDNEVMIERETSSAELPKRTEHWSD